VSYTIHTYIAGNNSISIAAEAAFKAAAKLRPAQTGKACETATCFFFFATPFPSVIGLVVAALHNIVVTLHLLLLGHHHLLLGHHHLLLLAHHHLLLAAVNWLAHHRLLASVGVLLLLVVVVGHAMVYVCSLLWF
jgi:hypothetical protein